MNNVILLPTRIRDARITQLAAAFGREPFSVEAAADVLGLPLKDTWRLLFLEPLSDDIYRVSPYNLDFWLIPQDPAKAALAHWRKRYVPLMRSLGGFFTANDFANAASIPYPSANFLLSQFVQAKVVEVSMGGQEQMVGYRVIRRVNVRPKGLTYCAD